MAVDGNGNPNYISPLVSAPVTGTPTSITPGGVLVVSGGTLFTSCYVRQNSKLISVLW